MLFGNSTPDSAASPSRPGGPQAPVLEHKFTFPAPVGEILLHWLDHACLQDTEYPDNIVSSIYFDTPELDAYRQKADGEFLKSKARLRWYGPVEDNPAGRGRGIRGMPAAGESDQKCYLELKSKAGSRRDKDRLELSMNRDTLRQEPLNGSGIWELAERLPELDPTSPPWIVPVLLVTYRRRRYFDHMNGLRISVDTEISCPAINETSFKGTAPAYIDTGVLEIKGSTKETPSSILPILRFMERAAFSKYAACIEGTGIYD